MPTKSQKDNTVRMLRNGVSNILNGVGQVKEALATDQITGVIRDLADQDLTGENDGLTAEQIRAGAAALGKILSDLQDAQKNPDIAGRIYDIRL